MLPSPSGTIRAPGRFLSRAAPVLFLTVALALLVLSWQGFFFTRATLPWVAAGLLALLGLWGAFRSRKRRIGAALFSIGVVCAVLAPAAQRARQLLENGRVERTVLAEIGGRAAPPLAYAEVVGEGADPPLYGEDLVVLNFWATWCPPCLKEMPILQAFVDRHRGEPVRVLGVTAFYGARDDDRAQILRLREERGVSYPTYVADGVENLEAFRVHALPTTVLLDAETVVGYGIGIRGAERVLAEAERRLEARRRG